MANTYQSAAGGPVIPWENGPVSLMASAQITGDTTGSLVPELGRGIVCAVVDATIIAALTAGTNELHIALEANTVAAATTWHKFANLRLDGTIIDTLGKFFMMGYNQYDYQVRVDIVELGTADVTMSIAAYVIRDKVGI